jgi:hypothetical protein
LAGYAALRKAAQASSGHFLAASLCRKKIIFSKVVNNCAASGPLLLGSRSLSRKGLIMPVGFRVRKEYINKNIQG